MPTSLRLRLNVKHERDKQTCATRTSHFSRRVSHVRCKVSQSYSTESVRRLFPRTKFTRSVLICGISSHRSLECAIDQLRLQLV